MEEKRTSGRSKKPAKQPDEGAWDCSVCTFKNSAEAYKCEICDVRKGTSTRKPKINPQIVAQQVAQQFAAPLTPPPGSPVPDDDSQGLEPVSSGTTDRLGPPPPPRLAPKKEGSKREKSRITSKQEKILTTHQQKKKQSVSKLRNIDRSTARHMSVTVDNITVVITDYQPKKRKISMETGRNSVQSDTSDSSSNASNDIHDERTHGENQT